MKSSTQDEIRPDRAVMGIPVFNGFVLIAFGVLISAANWSFMHSGILVTLLPILLFGGAGSIFMVLALFLPKPTRAVVTVSIICGGLMLAALGFAVIVMLVRGSADHEISVMILVMTLAILLQID